MTFKVRGTDTSDWKTITYPMSYPEATYDANAYSMGLSDIPVQYNITTDATTLGVETCD